VNLATMSYSAVTSAVFVPLVIAILLVIRAGLRDRPR
jgi:hypothetical protein